MWQSRGQAARACPKGGLLTGLGMMVPGSGSVWTHGEHSFLHTKTKKNTSYIVSDYTLYNLQNVRSNIEAVLGIQ